MYTYLSPLFLLLFFALAGCQNTASEEQDTADTTEANEQARIPVTTSSDEALAQYHSARQLLERGQREEARTSLDQVIATDPNFAMAYLMRAGLASSAGEFREVLGKALALADGVSEAEQIQIQMYETELRGAAKERLSLAQRLVELQPEVAEAHLYLGWAHQVNDQHDRARAAFRRAIELAPQWEVPYQELAGSLLSNDPKDLAAGQENLEKAVALAPDSYQARMYLGEAYRLRNQLEQARQAYRKASELDAEAADPHLYLGRVNTLLGNYAEARQNFSTHRDLSTDDKLSSLLAEAYIPLYEGNADQAVTQLWQNFDRLGELGISEAQHAGAKLTMLNNLTWIALHQDDPALLTKVAEQMQIVAPRWAAELGSTEAEAAAGAQEMRFNSMLAALRNQPAEANQLAEQYLEAISVIENIGTEKDYHFLLGFNALQQEDYATAVDHLKQSNTDFAYTKYLLAQAYQGAGDEEKSLTLLNELNTLNYTGVGYALVRKEVKEQLMPS
jgi:tetratricopeptide (TPR) repeat protein